MTCGARGKAGLMVVLSLIAFGCARPARQWETLMPRPATYQPVAFAHRIVSEDVEIFWNCSRPQPSLLRVDGIAKNDGKGEVHLLQLELHDVDRLTGTILQSASAVSDIILHPDIFSPIQVELQPATAEGQVDLLYTYRITSLGIIQTTNTDKEIMARDACSATQYPNPFGSK